MSDHSAVLYSDVAASTLVANVESIWSDLGYERVTGEGDIAVQIWTTSKRACVGVGLAKSLGLGLARKVAARTRSSVRVFSASLVIERTRTYECLVDDLTIRKDGSSSVGPWGSDMTSEYGENWDDICDGKPHLAVSALLQLAVDSVIPGANQTTYGLRAPPSLGDARLDAIATQIRFADRAELTTIAGRACARITNAGTTSTSFLEPNEVDALRAACSLR